MKRAALTIFLMLGLAGCNTTSSGVESASEFAQLFQRAAAGNPLAQLQLGLNYRTGVGVVQDHTLAANFFRKAADKGLLPAQYILASQYLDGVGVPKDNLQAHFWASLAAGRGSRAGRSIREKAGRFLDQAKLDESYRLIDDWISSHLTSHEVLLIDGRPPQDYQTHCELVSIQLEETELFIASSDLGQELIRFTNLIKQMQTWPTIFSVYQDNLRQASRDAERRRSGLQAISHAKNCIAQ